MRIPASLWCSSPCPTPTPRPRFAVGTSEGLYIVERDQTDWITKRIPAPGDVSGGRRVSGGRHGGSSHTSVTGVEWLSSEVVVCGLKDSAIFLHDVRSRGSASRLQHTHSVGKIRKVDPYRLVVSGQRSVRINFWIWV